MIGARVNLDDVERGYRNMERGARDLRAILPDVAQRLEREIGDHARQRRGIDGGWAPYAASTAEKLANARRVSSRFVGPLTRSQTKDRRQDRRKYVGARGGILRAGVRRLNTMLGRLPYGVRVTIHRLGVIAEAMADIAPFHEFGTPEVPARSYMYASRELVDWFQRHVVDRLEQRYASRAAR